MQPGFIATEVVKTCYKNVREFVRVINSSLLGLREKIKAKRVMGPTGVPSRGRAGRLHSRCRIFNLSQEQRDDRSAGRAG